MNKRVYLSQNSCLTTRGEDTPVRLRIPRSTATAAILILACKGFEVAN